MKNKTIWVILFCSGLINWAVLSDALAAEQVEPHTPWQSPICCGPNGKAQVPTVNKSQGAAKQNKAKQDKDNEDEAELAIPARRRTR